MADLMERPLLVSKLETTGFYLLLKIPARRRVQDTSHVKINAGAVMPDMCVDFLGCFELCFASGGLKVFYLNGSV